MDRWGAPIPVKRPTEGLRWYEYLFCCCKCRGTCLSCVLITVIYYVPIILLIALAVCNVFFGVYWRNECGYQPLLPYWMIISALSPFLLLPFIKAVKDPYFGVTCWRALSVALYLVFFAWLITGSIWNFETFKSATDAQCKKVLKIYALALTCVHWLLFALATIPQVYILTKVCCCCTENAIRPLKPHMNVEENI